MTSAEDADDIACISATVVFGNLAQKNSFGPIVIPSPTEEDAVPASNTM